MHLLSIICLCTSPYATVDAAGELQVLVECYLAEFKALYPTLGLKPKHHFLLHMNLQIIGYGPWRNLWLTCCEAKNNSFKNFKFKNFINLPLLMAKFCHIRSCHSFMNVTGDKSENYLYSGDSVKEGNNTDLSQDFPGLVNGVHMLLSENMSVLYQTEEVVIQGLKYRPGVALLLNWRMNIPLFAMIVVS